MARVLERVELRVVAAVALQRDRHEDAVLAIDRGRSERLVVHGHQALAVLAERLGQELFDPGAEAAELAREHERHLVAAGLGQPRERRAEPDRGVVAGAHRVAAGLDHGVGAVEQRLDVDADQRRGHEAEEGQGREAPADRGRVEEGAAEARLGRELVERPAGVGDGDEMYARARYRGGLDLCAEILVEGQGLGRGPGLGGDDEERARQVEPIERVLDRRRIGRVEQEEIRVAHLGPEGQVEHVTAERRASHAQ
jgi:hypothetical protein